MLVTLLSIIRWDARWSIEHYSIISIVAFKILFVSMTRMIVIVHALLKCLKIQFKSTHLRLISVNSSQVNFNQLISDQSQLIHFKSISVNSSQINLNQLISNQSQSTHLRSISINSFQIIFNQLISNQFKSVRLTINLIDKW